MTNKAGRPFSLSSFFFSLSEGGTIKYCKGTLEVGDVAHHLSAADRAAALSSAHLPHQTEFRRQPGPRQPTRLGILPTILCSLFHIPGSVSGGIRRVSEETSALACVRSVSLNPSLPPSLAPRVISTSVSTHYLFI